MRKMKTGLVRLKLILILLAHVLHDDVKEIYNRLSVSSLANLLAVITHRNACLGSR